MGGNSLDIGDANHADLSAASIRRLPTPASAERPAVGSTQVGERLESASLPSEHSIVGEASVQHFAGERELSGKRAFLGGSFDPFHQGHLNQVKGLLKLGFEHVSVVPVLKNPLKWSNNLSAISTRAEMIRAVLRSEGIAIAQTPGAKGVYVPDSPLRILREQAKIALPSTFFVTGADNNESWSASGAWRALRGLAERKIVVMNSNSPVHSSAIRAGTEPPHPATREIIEREKLYEAS